MKEKYIPRKIDGKFQKILHDWKEKKQQEKIIDDIGVYVPNPVPVKEEPVKHTKAGKVIQPKETIKANTDNKLEFNYQKFNYLTFIENNFKIFDNREVSNTKGQYVPFKLNAPQKSFYNDIYNKVVVLKSRKEGFSSLIDAIFTVDFLFRQNSRNVIVADNEDNASVLLERVKIYIASYEEINRIKVPLKYNSRNELFCEVMNTKFKIGTAENIDFGRSTDITNLHLSEVAFYGHLKQILAGAGQAVVQDGRCILETTANGFNDFKKFWTDSHIHINGFKKLFYKASDFYSKEFLSQKKKELGELFPQEYPENDIEAFVTSGSCYFDKQALQHLLSISRKPAIYNLGNLNV
ncbi:MAG: hypothetical protein PHY08_09070 [Candidatus Cloacimonetes bacterium]|nr:hypothetical protein [Candidatus Cloacimonadota bacterium]